MPFTDLPVELHLQILGFYIQNIRDQIIAVQVCHLWRSILSGSEFKKVRYNPSGAHVLLQGLGDPFDSWLRHKTTERLFLWMDIEKSKNIKRYFLKIGTVWIDEELDISNSPFLDETAFYTLLDDEAGPADTGEQIVTKASVHISVKVLDLDHNRPTRYSSGYYQLHCNLTDSTTVRDFLTNFIPELIKSMARWNMKVERSYSTSVIYIPQDSWRGRSSFFKVVIYEHSGPPPKRIPNPFRSRYFRKAAEGYQAFIDRNQVWRP